MHWTFAVVTHSGHSSILLCFASICLQDRYMQQCYVWPAGMWEMEPGCLATSPALTFPTKIWSAKQTGNAEFSGWRSDTSRLPVLRSHSYQVSRTSCVPFAKKSSNLLEQICNIHHLKTSSHLASLCPACLHRAVHSLNSVICCSLFCVRPDDWSTDVCLVLHPLSQTYE